MSPGARVGLGGGNRGAYGGTARGLGYGVGFHGYLGALPRGYVTYRYGGSPCFFCGGLWYRPWGVGFASFYPPIGLCIPFLPLGYGTCYYSGVPYFYYQDVYYNIGPSGGYVVADPPPDVSQTVLPPRGARTDTSALDALLVIPKAGQTEEMMLSDRQKAQRYAVEESGYDPDNSDPSDPGTPRARRAYLRALKSYLEERGYAVK